MGFLAARPVGGGDGNSAPKEGVDKDLRMREKLSAAAAHSGPPRCWPGVVGWSGLSQDGGGLVNDDGAPPRPHPPNMLFKVAPSLPARPPCSPEDPWRKKGKHHYFFNLGLVLFLELACP